MMKKVNLIIVIYFLFIQLTYGQTLKSPKNIDEAISILKVDCPENLQEIIKKTPEKELINLRYPFGVEYKKIYSWVSTKNSSKLVRYLTKEGVKYFEHQQTIILIAFKRHLLKQKIKEEEIINKFKRIEKQWKKEDKIRFVSDTLRGHYIPKDILDCIKQIDSFWDDSTKNKVKTWSENEFGDITHHGFGMWIRNNWQLWSGSRLSKYFNSFGVTEPDDISDIILNCYHRHLTGKDIRFEEEVKGYEDFEYDEDD